MSIEEDLERRDLTINAIAKDGDGNIFDPYGGIADIEDRVLRHVSDAFVEDPVRILRVARFAARFHDLGFTVAEETLDLMRRMVAAGEVDALVADRVWKETELALAGRNARVYFEVLRECGALRVLFPEVDALFGVPQPERWHPEIDTGLHVMMVIEQAEAVERRSRSTFCCLDPRSRQRQYREARSPQSPGSRNSRLQIDSRHE